MYRRVRAVIFVLHVTATYIQVLHRFCYVKLIHGRYDDGRSGEKEEQEEEATVDHKAAEPPIYATY